ncbi:hypothetical protein HK103_000617 [Boothiomyces macroporosus]|uniref:Uncharacterized protein n=1 Tax=Boothiomyces macroporosus TaxID=261099 RepID=A0AAD5Y7G3_9FUNG|nr:hypothetical protein HK103_000617 [Boothiomyces macroporosus]
MIVDRGMYSSTNCDYQQSFLVTGMPNSGSEGDCREFINGSNDSFAYSYDIKAQQCHLYDLQLQNLTMIRNSSTLESTSDSSKTGLIVGIVILIILVVLGIAGYIYYKKQNRPSGNTRGTKLDYQKVANDRCQVLLDNEMAPDKNIAASKVVHVKGISDTAFQTDPCMFSINELKNTPLNVNPTQMPASNQFSNDSSPTTAVNSPTSSAVNRESGITVLQQAIKRIQQENQIPSPPVMERKEISENTVDTAIPKAEDKHFIDPPKLAQHIPVAFCEPKLL